ncbi:helix-turn-helix domain-containing protein [Eubacteriales bacterium OttesenSCG-928-N13]|nr:helix-turn-helix domain-containing protein [Eubacteriales bacterium OttesenSCG-928-N13]
MDYKEVGRRIRVLRKNKHWTQEVMAEAANISLSFLGHIERGTRKASVETLVAIANVLETSLDRLLRSDLTHPERPTIDPENLKKLQTATKMLNEIQQELA